MKASLDVKINGDKKVSLTLDADINHLELDTESTVSTTANASVYRMTASKPASVTGYGTIYQAEIKSSGVSFASSVRVSGYNDRKRRDCHRRRTDAHGQHDGGCFAGKHSGRFE